MKLIFERSGAGRHLDLLPANDVAHSALPAEFARTKKPALPEVSEIDLSRHYTELAKQTHGVNDGVMAALPLSGLVTISSSPLRW